MIDPGLFVQETSSVYKPIFPLTEAKGRKINRPHSKIYKRKKVMGMYENQCTEGR